MSPAQQGLIERAREIDAAATPAEAPGERGGWPARWFASGPEGEFFTSSHAFAEALIAGRDRDDWTITDLSEGDTCTAPAAPAGDALLQRVIGDVESGDYDGGISEATYNSISAYLAAAAAAPAPFPSGNIHSPIQDTPPEYSRAGTPDAPAAPATNPDEISSKLVEPAAPAEGAWVAMISGIDEYGPMLDWNTHWVDVGVGTKLYTASRVTGGRAITAAMVDAACEAYWGDGWQEPEHEGIAEARRIDARFMLEAALQAATGGASE